MMPVIGTRCLVALCIASFLPAWVPVDSFGRFFVSAQEGGPLIGPASSPQSANYSCDPTTCTIANNCQCASVRPPNGLSPSLVPQFVTYTSDDAVQSYTTAVLSDFMGDRLNPNGCAVKSTWFVSSNYTNYGLVTDFFVAGNEVADHTMTHVGNPPASEIIGNLRALNSFGGIPLSAISGFRAPLLNFTRDTLTLLSDSGFLYDSSGTSASPANATNTDAFWPYTLDHGFANNCLNQPALCSGLRLPGFWEIPMYATFDASGTSIHLMDVWLDSTDQQQVLDWLKHTFLSHYNGNRQPFGIYTHPVHLATGYPGLADPLAIRSTLANFLDWIQTHQDVWFVTNQQLISWMKDPIPASQLASASYLHCSLPNVTAKICNGMPANEAGLQTHCDFPDFPWQTCYGCPIQPPTPSNPVPAQNTALGVRSHLPSNCSTAFFDPIKNVCLCVGNQSSCAFVDTTRPLGNYSTTSEGSSSSNSSDGTSSGALPSFSNTPSRSLARRSLSFPRLTSPSRHLSLPLSLLAPSFMSSLWFFRLGFGGHDE